MAFVSSAFERKIIPLRDERGALFIPDRNYGHHEISRGRRGRSRRILPSRPDCLNGISRICWKIDTRANVRTDTQPPGQGSEPHLDFHRDRSRRDACPTLRPRPENNPVKGQARNLFIPDRNYCHYQISQAARHSLNSRNPLHAGHVFRGFPIHLRYGLPGCSPPFDGSNQVSPAPEGFYFQAFRSLVTPPAAGYHYNMDWTPCVGGTCTRWNGS